MNTDKCHLVTNHADDVSAKRGCGVADGCGVCVGGGGGGSAKIEGVIIKFKKSVKFLGINIDNKLDFDKTVSLKLHILSRI